MVNVVNLNFLLAENDIHVPAGGVSLDFSRVYNSESQHDALNDDNSTPSVYGNRWTNNLDVHLAWSATQGNTGTVSVYASDGARDDFTCNVGTTNLCTVSTPGIYDLLAPTQIGGAGVACQFQLTKKSGVTYIFNAPYQGCSFGQGSYGRLQAIYARNSTFSIQLTYKWAPDDSNAENITQIVATHEPDGAQLTLNFSQVAGSSPPITELSSIERPDGPATMLYYYYTTTGELVDVGKPGNNPILPAGEPLPANFADGNTIGTGNLPETYDIEHAGLLEVCGPRAAIAIIDNPSDPEDGACVDFDYSNHQLSDWWTRGVLNPTPGDNIVTAPIQSGPSTGFVQWDDTTFFNNMEGEGCGYAAVMTDPFSHQVIWCYDSSNRVTQIFVILNSSGATLSTAQTWDSNNDLGSMTDARGFTTYLAYDPNGNVVELSLPSQATSKGTLRPTYLLDYDQYNNLVDFCDPTNNANNGWNPSQSDTLCENSGSSHYATYTYKFTDPNEQYGCLKNSSPPSNYSWNVTYGGGQCGNGLPTTVAAATPYPQDDGTNRQPTQTFSYNANGTINTDSRNNPHGTVWQYNYTNDGMNRIRSISDPDGVTSYQCYNQDGSLFYSETAQQNNLDDVNSCPTVAQLEGGISPPPYATSYGYDPDGNTATALHHHGCGGSGCTANKSSPNNCNKAAVSLGTACYFYDGLDRLVEVRQPLAPADLYSKPWITRYLYDLTGGYYTFHGNSLLAYGNLFETEELLPSTATTSITGTPNPQPTSISNTSYVTLAAFAYDGADRLITKYAAVAGSGSNSATTQTLTWDKSPLDSNLGGLLGKTCNSATSPPQGQCQEFDYYPDGEEETFASNDNSAPQRNYTYDPDGRPITINNGYVNPQTYAYDVNGNVVTASDAGGTQDYATLTYNRYPDGSEESLDVSSQAFTQKQLFDYSYRNDGPLQTYVISDGSLGKNIQNPGQTTLAYSYTDAGRFLTRAESGRAANPNLPQTQITYTSNPATGLIQSETTPVTNLSTFEYTAESELAQVTPNNPFCYYGAVSFGYSLRGELGGSTACPPQYSLGSNFANGVVVQSGITPQTNSWTWNNLMAVLTGENLNGQASSWAYDGAGRMTSESEPNPVSTASPPPSVTTTRTYDAENHLSQTTFFASPSPNPDYRTVQWGPDGHPITIGASNHGGPVNDERLHWDGDQLLFTSHNSNGAQTVDDIKVDVQGDILPGDATGYNDLTFYDRGPGGTIMGCHNATGTTFEGLGDSWKGFPLGSCQSNKSQGAKMPDSILWGGSPYGCGCGKPLGIGGTLGMYRTDGFTDGFDTIQGVRSYDPTLGSWTTPDAYGGDIFDPSSVKSYLWNGNNPISNMDPSGYVLQNQQPPEFPPFWPTGPNLCDPASDTGCGAPSKGGGLKTIAVVTAHKPHSAPFCNGPAPATANGYQRGPDYTAIRIGIGEIFSGTYEIVIDSQGNVYGGSGLSAGISLSPLNVALVSGRINPLSPTGETAQQNQSFITGMTYTGSAVAIFGGGITVNPNPLNMATEAQAGVPAVGIGVSDGMVLGNVPGC